MKLTLPPLKNQLNQLARLFPHLQTNDVFGNVESTSPNLIAVPNWGYLADYYGHASWRMMMVFGWFMWQKFNTNIYHDSALISHFQRLWTNSKSAQRSRMFHIWEVSINKGIEVPSGHEHLGFVEGLAMLIADPTPIFDGSALINFAGSIVSIDGDTSVGFVQGDASLPRLGIRTLLDDEFQYFVTGRLVGNLVSA